MEQFYFPPQPKIWSFAFRSRTAPSPFIDLFDPAENVEEKITLLIPQCSDNMLWLKELFDEMRNRKIRLTSICPEIIPGEKPVTIEETLERFEEILGLFIKHELVPQECLLMPLFIHRHIFCLPYFNTKNLLDKGTQLLTSEQIDHHFTQWNVFNKSDTEKQEYINLQLFYQLQENLPAKVSKNPKTKV